VARIADDIPDVVPAGDPDGDLLVVGWGSTFGAITAAVREQRERGRRIGHVHLRHLNPMPRNLGEVMKRYRKVLVPEMNLGQLAFVLRGRYLVDAIAYTKVQGKPFKVGEVVAKIDEVLK
jgi:2-oxoglutarate ferredoxin oxidoreductase subunit alpha